jgi:hypothetical protein
MKTAIWRFSAVSFHGQIGRFAWANEPKNAVRFTFHTPTPVKCEMKGNEREMGEREKVSKKSFFDSPHAHTRAASSLLKDLDQPRSARLLHRGCG